jgi:hypothetical protein
VLTDVRFLLTSWVLPTNFEDSDEWLAIELAQGEAKTGRRIRLFHEALSGHLSARFPAVDQLK